VLSADDGLLFILCFAADADVLPPSCALVGGFAISVLGLCLVVNV